MYIVLAFIAWSFLGFVVFYFRYKHKDTVNELRSNLKQANHEVHRLNQEAEEYMQQNILLKNKMGEFLNRNDDLSHVVGELSKYYYHIKKAAEKTEELNKFLSQPDPEVEERMQAYLSNDSHKKHKHDDENLIGKWFF